MNCPFQVQCISKQMPVEKDPDLIAAFKAIEIGRTYTVVSDSSTGYELAEFPHERTIRWSKIHFIAPTFLTASEMYEQEIEGVLK